MALKRKINLNVGLRKNTNVKAAGYNKYYAQVVQREGLTMHGFIEHVRQHIPGISISAVVAVVETLTQCIPELCARGVSVKLDGLGTFYPTIKNRYQGVKPIDMMQGEPTADSAIDGVFIRFKPERSQFDALTSKALREKSAINLAGVFANFKSTGDEDYNDVLIPMDVFKNKVNPQPHP